jgi:hypothetical protein
MSVQNSINCDLWNHLEGILWYSRLCSVSQGVEVIRSAEEKGLPLGRPNDRRMLTNSKREISASPLHHSLHSFNLRSPIPKGQLIRVTQFRCLCRCVGRPPSCCCFMQVYGVETECLQPSLISEPIDIRNLLRSTEPFCDGVQPPVQSMLKVVLVGSNRGRMLLSKA